MKNGSDGDVLVLPAGRRQVALLMLAGVAMGVGGWELMQQIGNVGELWLLVAGGGVCLLGGLIILVTGKPALVLGREGFEIRTMMGAEVFRWEHVYDFTVVYRTPHLVPGTQCVGFRIRPEHAVSATARRINRSVLGVDAALPLNFGLRAAELAKLLQQWQAKMIAAAAELRSEVGR